MQFARKYNVPIFTDRALPQAIPKNPNILTRIILKAILRITIIADAIDINCGLSIAMQTAAATCAMVFIKNPKLRIRITRIDLP